jgi:succinate dehydrogenase / fumarate reductase cytochrome b subunit
MAQAGNTARGRPLSPHLQIWRWGPHMLSSILNRITGIAATVGLLLLLWWLGALVTGPAAYANFAWAVTSPIGYIVLVGISWAVFSHAITGVRHFVLDIGAGYEIETNKRWATICTVLGFVLTAVFWAAYVLLHR